MAPGGATNPSAAGGGCSEDLLAQRSKLAAAIAAPASFGYRKGESFRAPPVAGYRNKPKLPQKKHGFARMRERRAVQARQCFFQEFAPPARTLAASRRLARRLDAADRAGYHKRNRPCRPPQRTTFSPSKSAGGSRKLRFLREFAAKRQTSPGGTFVAQRRTS